MLTVAKDFIYNGVEYKKGGWVSPALFEADDKAALLHGKFLLDPSAPVEPLPPLTITPENKVVRMGKKAGRK